MNVYVHAHLIANLLQQAHAACPSHLATYTHTQSHHHSSPTYTQEHKAILAPLIANLLHQAHAACPSHLPTNSASAAVTAAELQAVLAKEAVMGAVAVGVYELQEHVQFTPWLRSALLQVGVKRKRVCVCVFSYGQCIAYTSDKRRALCTMGV